MKIQFTLKNVTGSALLRRFAVALNEEGVGYDPDFTASAGLSQDGKSWTTFWSGFTYTIVNPESNDPAIVEYEGGHRGFLAQNLLPEELRGETIHAEVVEGSALARHGVEKFLHSDASLLAEAYGLMQRASHRPMNPNREPFKMALEAIEAVQRIRSHMSGIGVESTSFVNVGANSHGSGCINTYDGDPAVYVTCCPAGESVTLEIPVHPWGSESSAEGIASRAIAWLDRLRPVLSA